MFVCLLLAVFITLVQSFNTLQGSDCLKNRPIRLWAINKKDSVMGDMVDDLPKPLKLKNLDEVASSTINKSKTISDVGVGQDLTQKAAKQKEMSLLEQSRQRRATFGSLSVEDLKSRMVEEEPPRMKIQTKQENLNGISPLKPIAFAGVSAGMSYTMWTLSVYCAGHFGIEFLDPNQTVYPVYRFTVFARNVVVGILTLGAGFSGIITGGLLLLSGRIFYGVQKGELDPDDVSSMSTIDIWGRPRVPTGTSAGYGNDDE